jgi:WD40 repeat protein
MHEANRVTRRNERRAILALLLGILASVSSGGQQIGGKSGSGREVVAHIVVENGQPVITNGKMAAIDKGSNDGINEGDLFTLRRSNSTNNVLVVGNIVSVFPAYSLLLIPTDMAGTTIVPTDTFVHFMADESQVRITPQVGHNGHIQTIAFSQDDTLIGTGDSDGIVKVWSVTDGRLRITFKAGVSVVGIQFTSDRKRLITATEDNRNNLKVWSIETGRIITTLIDETALKQYPTQRQNGIALSPAENLLASSSWDGVVRLWSLDTYQLRCKTEKEGPSLYKGIAFSADGKLVLASVTGLGDRGAVFRRIRGWSTNSCKFDHDLDPQPQKEKNFTDIGSLATLAHSNLLASGDDDGTIDLWNVQSAQVVNHYSLHERIISLSSPDNAHWVVYGTGSGRVGIWNFETGNAKTFQPPTDDVVLSVGVSASHGGNLIAWGEDDGNVSIYDISGQRRLWLLQAQPDYITKIVPLADHKNVTTVFNSGKVQVWKVDAGEAAPQVVDTGEIDQDTCVSDKGYALFVEKDRVMIRSLVSSEPPRFVSIGNHSFDEGALKCALFSDGELFALGKANGQVDVWDNRKHTKTTLGEAHDLLFDSAFIEHLEFSPDGTKVAWTDMKARAELWDIATAKNIKTWPQGVPNSTIAFSNQGDHLASSGGFDLFTTVVSSQNNGSIVKLGENWGGNFGGLSFSPDGARLAIAAHNSVAIWDIKSSRIVTVLYNTSLIEALSFMSDGSTVLTASDDSTFSLWNASDGSLLCTFLPIGESDWLAFTPEGFFDGTRASWELVPFHFQSAPLQLYEPEQFFNEFFQPGLLGDVIRTGKSIRDILQKRNDPRADLDIARYKNSHLAQVNIATASPTVSGQISVTVTAIDTGSGVEDCRVFRNESLVHFEHGIPGIAIAPNTRSFPVAIKLGQGINELSAYCFNQDGLRSKEETLEVTNSSPTTIRHAYIVAIGIDTYANGDFNLSYAAPDADDIEKTLSQNLQALGEFQPVPVVLRDTEASKAAVLAALGRLSGEQRVLPRGAPKDIERLAAAGPEDIVVVFFAGHGIGDQGRYYLIPSDLGYQGPREHISASDLEIVKQHSISDEELRQAFENIDARLNVLIVDACESGTALDSADQRPGPMNARGLAQLAYDKGMYVLTAAQSKEAALEAGGNFGHGLLTYALVEEGLKTRDAYTDPSEARLTIRQWFDYAVRRVPELQVKLMENTRGRNLSVVQGEENISDPAKRSLQHPRVFYRREIELHQIFVADARRNPR